MIITRKMRNSLLLLAYFIFMFAHTAAEESKYQGLLWEITGNGLEKPCYLFGTMHVSKKVAFHLSDSLYLAIKSVDVVSLEVDPSSMLEDYMNSDIFRSVFNMGSGSRLNKNNFYKKAFYFTFPGDKYLGDMLSKDDAVINGLLYRRFGDYGDNFRENTYLDLYIFQTAKKMNKDVTGLENFDEMMDLSVKAMMPDDNSERPSNSARSRFTKKLKPGETLNDVLEDAYRKGNLDLIDSLTRIMNPSRNYRRYLLYERNKNMAARFEEITGERALFAAVGAAHLPGEKGLINILREKGYSVRPVVKTITDFSRDLKKKLEDTRYPLVYKTQFPADSLFSVDLPGKIIELPQMDEYRQLYYPEMINGAYYSITRINTYGPVFNLTADDVIKKLDSLFFENIPGEIISKKEISQNGYKGFDILNRLLRGDEQRYRLYVTPFEIIIFKMSGTGDFVSTEEGNKFFDSIRFYPDENTSWNSRDYSESGFRISMPGMWTDNFYKTIMMLDKNNEIQAIDKDDGAYYLLKKAVLNDFDYIEEDTFELNYLSEKIASMLDYNIAGRKLLAYKGYPSIDVNAADKNDEHMINFRLVIRGRDYYLLLTKGSSDSKKEKFLNSLEFTNYTYTDPYEEYVDTTMHFSVTTFKQPMDAINMYGSFYRSKYNLKKGDIEPEYLHKEFICKSTGEKIRVEYIKFQKYYSYEKPDSFWNRRINLLLDEASFHIKDKYLRKNKDISIMDLDLNDTNSINNLKIRMIQKGDVIYIITATFDSLTKASPFTRKFFETFAPADTTIGRGIFTDKTSMFIDALNGTDSTEKDHAEKSLEYLEFRDNDASKLMELIRNYNFSEKDLERRSILIEYLGSLHNDSIVPFLKEIYMAAGDTSTLQLAILEALAEQGSSESAIAFLDMLRYETPLANDDWEILSVFIPFLDSPGSAAAIYPGLLEFLQYPEYKVPVYKLLAVLVDSSLVSDTVYKPFLKRLIRETKNEIKRKFASEEGSSSNEYYDTYYDEDYIKFNNELAGESMLLNYVRLLLPYKDDPRVKRLFDRLMTTGDLYLKMKTTELFLKNDFPVADSVFQEITSGYKYRIPFYNILKKIDKLNLFPKKYISQEEMAKAALYSYGFDAGKDSLQFFDKRPGCNKYGTGYVYFFKRKNSGKNNWYLDYTGFQPEDDNGLNLSADIIEKGTEIDKNENLDKLIDEALNKVRTIGRKRVSGKRYDWYYD